MFSFLKKSGCEPDPIKPSYSGQSGSGGGDTGNVRRGGEEIYSSNLKAFSFADLRSATRNFRPDSLIGEGGFGYVFKGWIDEQTSTPSKRSSGQIIAVKRLKPEGFQGHKEWLVCRSSSSLLLRWFLNFILILSFLTLFSAVLGRYSADGGELPWTASPPQSS